MDRSNNPGARLKRPLMGTAVAAASFLALGTVTALWENPFFLRMTPASSLEISLLAALSLIVGVYVAIRRPHCSVKTISVGGVAGFLGIACPVCNKILLFALGADLLLTYFEPVRIYVAAAGVAIAGLALIREWMAANNSESAPVPETTRAISS